MPPYRRPSELVLNRSEPCGSQNVYRLRAGAYGGLVSGGLLAIEGAGQGLEPGLNASDAPAGQPVDEEAAQASEDHLGDLELALVGPFRRANRQHRRQVL